MATFKEISSKTWDFYQRHRLLINFVLLSVVYLICCVTSVGAYFALVLLSYLTFSEKNYGGVYYLVFSVPFVNVLVIGQYGYVLLIIAALFVIYAFIRVFIVEKCKINLVSLVMLLLLEIYLALPINEYATIGFLKMGTFLLIFMFLEVAREKCRLIDFKTFLYSYIYAFLISSAFGVVFASSPIVQAFSTQFFYNDRMRFIGLIGNPNIFAIFALMAICFTAYLVFNDKKRIYNSLLFILTFVLGILSMSKMFFLMSLVIVFFIIIKLFVNNPKKALIFCGCLFVLCGLVYLCFTNFAVSLFNRFFSATKFEDIKTFNWSEFLTFRNELWGEYLINIFANPHNIFLGIGLGHDSLPGIQYPHNVYIQLISQMGIVGFLIIAVGLIYMIAQIYKSARMSKKVDWFMYVPLLIMSMVIFVV